MDCVSKLHYRCPVCSGVFAEFIIFEGHITFSRQCRENIGFYMQCYACKREFKNLAALKYHLQHQQQECLVVYEAKDENNFNFINELEVCDVNYGETAGSDVAQQTHVPKESKLISFYCGACGKGFTTKIDLIQHSATHYIAAVNKNKSQAFHARTLAKLDRTFHQEENHIKIHSNVRDKQTDLSLRGKRIKGPVNQCQLCKAKFALYITLKRHMEVHTLGTIACDICKVMFTRNSLIQHQKMFHSNNIQKIGKRNQTRPSNFSLKKKNIKGRGYQCSLCKANFSFPCKLKQHTTVHTFGTIACNSCKVMFTLPALIQHQKVFHANSIQKMIKRNQTSRCVTDLSLRRKNIKGRGYQCALCKDNFSLPSKLKQHMTVHTFGTIACDICKVLFTPSALMKHQRVCNSHNIQKIYKCHLDGDRAPFRSYECYVCKITLPTFHDLTHHKDKHSVYQQWIDPSNIILSNWRPEDSQEILQNQPLVLVENLKIDQISLASLGGFTDGNSRSKLLERTIDSTQEYEMESTSTDHAECYVKFGCENVKLERNLSECETKDNCTEVVEGNEIVDFLRTVGNRLVNYSQLMQEVYSKSVKVETQTDDNAIMVNKTYIPSNVINIIDISSDSDDDDVEF